MTFVTMQNWVETLSFTSSQINECPLIGTEKYRRKYLEEC
jgi:hypothetical protein